MIRQIFEYLTLKQSFALTHVLIWSKIEQDPWIWILQLLHNCVMLLNRFVTLPLHFMMVILVRRTYFSVLFYKNLSWEWKCSSPYYYSTINIIELLVSLAKIHILYKKQWMSTNSLFVTKYLTIQHYAATVASPLTPDYMTEVLEDVQKLVYPKLVCFRSSSRSTAQTNVSKCAWSRGARGAQRLQLPSRRWRRIWAR